MFSRIFIDGQAGTTGLLLRDLTTSCASDLGWELISVPHELRKNPDARRDAYRRADIVVLCLPDDAAVQAVREIGCESDARILDASSAHRVADGWVYGFAELAAGLGEIENAHKVSNPGCYAIGSVALLRPLVQSGFLDPNASLSITGISGYSGGGNAMIARYEQDGVNGELYGLEGRHKHIPEIVKFSKLSATPVFLPAVGAFKRGMVVNVPLHPTVLKGGGTLSDLKKAAEEIYEKFYASSPFSDRYRIRFVTDAKARIAPSEKGGRFDMRLRVFEQAGGLVASAAFDNLGMGAAGNALRNLALMTGRKI